MRCIAVCRLTIRGTQPDKAKQTMRWRETLQSNAVTLHCAVFSQAVLEVEL